MNDAARGSRRLPTQPTNVERAAVLDLDLEWDAVDADPYLLANGRKAYLLLMTNQPSNGQPGPAIPGDQFPYVQKHCVVVDFLGFYAVRGFGGPGTATLTEHHLDGKGLLPNRGHQVVNSQWITYEEQVDATKRDFAGRPRAALHDHLRHYLFSFSEHTLEFLAEDIAVERRLASQAEMVTELARRLLTT
jgi:hypothetical protein